MTLPIIIIVLLFVSTCCFAFALFSQRAELKKSGKFEGLYFEASAEKSALQERCKNLEEKIKFLENTEEKLTATFKALSSDALFQNNQLFMDLANAVFERFHEKTKSETETGTKTVLNLVDPIKNALSGMGTKLEDLEKARIRAEESLKTQIENLISAQNVLETSAGHLVSVFKAPTIRGRWGEIHLRRVVELAGMVDHCDFEEQVFHEDDDGKIRPDMVVYLPEDRQIVIDAKVPLSAYLKAIETNDPKAKKTLMEEYAKQIRACISDLSGKKYREQFDKSPEFTVMFLPADIFLSSVLEYDRSLLEFSMREKIVIATPGTLFALLSTIALVWRRQNITENAEQMMKLGQELYKRLADAAQHISDLGKSINSTVSAYNQTVAGFENRVFVTARKFKNLEIHEKDIVESKIIDKSARAPVPELFDESAPG